MYVSLTQFAQSRNHRTSTDKRITPQGKVFSTAWSPDDPLTLAAAGSKAKVQVWDVGANAGARKALGPKLAELGRALKEKQSGGIVGVASDDEDSSGGSDDGEE